MPLEPNKRRGVGLRHTKKICMNKNRIEGAAGEIKGATKEVIGNATGNPRLANEGTIEKAKGAVQTAVGALKDAVSDVVKP
jgi:uncharacterized protein YjbJ (UPF0337 family)